MFKNHLKIAIRNLLKHKSFSLINILGLSVGISACLFIGVFIIDELSYDKFHTHADSIYRIYWEDANPQTRTPHPMTYELVKDMPEVENAVSLSPLWGPGLTRPDIEVRYEDKRFEEGGFLSADSTFFEIFPFPIIEGNPNQAMREPNMVVITEAIAQKYFEGESAIGKIFRLNNQRDYQVGAVIANVPAQSHLHFDFMISYVSLKPRTTGGYYQWGDFGHYNYLLLEEGVNAKELEAKLPEWALGYLNWPEAYQEALLGGEVAFRLQKMTDIHLISALKWELEPNGDINYIYIFLAVGAFILAIACINYINLTTARAMERGREIGLRKTLGADRGQIIRQFLGESFLYFLIATILALVITDLLFPWFNELTQKELSLQILGSTSIAFLLMGIFSMIILGAGVYPAVFLSGFKPVEVLKTKFFNHQDGARLRKGLVIFQFGISSLMIIATIVVYNQLHFLQQADLGFNDEELVIVPMKTRSMRENAENLKAELLKTPAISGATAVSNVPGGRFNQQSIAWKLNETDQNVSVVSVDHHYFETLGLKMRDGESFRPPVKDDTTIYFILNETAARLFDWERPVGEQIYYFDDNQTYQGQVLGIVEDYHFESLHKTIAPLVFVMSPNDFGYLMVKCQTDNLNHTLAKVEETWQSFDRESIFEYSFLNQDFASLYNTETRMGAVMSIFSGLAIMIACLGLFALVAFVVEQKTKEIGIRKVLGASASHLTWILSGELVKLIGASFLISIPVAWLLMDQWLTQFPYRIEVSLMTFVYTALLLISITFLTLFFQIIKAISENPIQALRDE
ncbi:MAG: ABC transporter permease [Bacteroidetes bacterium]|nr:ABC transporter permease [Bacteroidota bacterium]MCB0842951.1 ABC transporter permease [Bacteroidota bacterium]MCB0850706.1 ABC transporter permease [Bacteroidota bacterium]